MRESRALFRGMEKAGRAVGRGAGAAEDFYGTPEKEVIQKAYFAQAVAVLVGRKSLFHEALNAQDAAFLSDVFGDGMAAATLAGKREKRRLARFCDRLSRHADWLCHGAKLEG